MAKILRRPKKIVAKSVSYNGYTETPKNIFFATNHHKNSRKKWFPSFFYLSAPARTSWGDLNFKVAEIGICSGLVPPQKANFCIYSQIFMTTQKMATKSISYDGYTENPEIFFLLPTVVKTWP